MGDDAVDGRQCARQPAASRRIAQQRRQALARLPGHGEDMSSSESVSKHVMCGDEIIVNVLDPAIRLECLDQARLEGTGIEDGLLFRARHRQRKRQTRERSLGIRPYPCLKMRDAPRGPGRVVWQPDQISELFREIRWVMVMEKCCERAKDRQ